MNPLALLGLIPRWALLAALAGLGAFAGWQTIRLADVRGDLLDAREGMATLQTALESAKTAAANQAADMQRKVTEATNAARNREVALRAAADSARVQSDGLRDDLLTLRRGLADASREAAVERAAALGAVLGQCAARHQVLSERCDRHVSDLRTLIEAWPAAAPPSSPVP